MKEEKGAEVVPDGRLSMGWSKAPESLNFVSEDGRWSIGLSKSLLKNFK